MVFQPVNLLENFKGEVENDSGNEEIMSAEEITPQFGKSYPPKESDIIRKMCHYMLSKKRIPQNFECNPQILETYVPTEEQCFYYDTMLNQAEIANRVCESNATYNGKSGEKP